MNIHSIARYCCIPLLIILINPAYSDTRLGKEELKELITGKTLEGRWVLWDSNYRMYMHPSGQFKRFYGKGDKLDNDLSGSWWINKKGKLCLEVNKRVCRVVKRRGDGGYNLYSRDKTLKWTIEKITDGNPYNL